MAKLETLVEPWDNLDDWTAVDTAFTPVAAAGLLTYTMSDPTGAGNSSQVHELTDWDLDESSIVFSIQTGDLGSFISEFRLIHDDPSEPAIWVHWSGYENRMRVERFNGTTTITEINELAPDLPRWFRVREAAGTTHIDMSDDGVAWTESVTSWTTMAGHTNNTVRFFAHSDDAAGVIAWGDLNPSTAGAPQTINAAVSSSGHQLHAATVTPGGLSLTAALLDSGHQLFPGTVTAGGTINASAIPSGHQLHLATLAVEDVLAGDAGVVTVTGGLQTTITVTVEPGGFNVTATSTVQVSGRFAQGNVVTFRAEFRDINDQLVDPATDVFFWFQPSGVSGTQYSNNADPSVLIRDDTGRYHVDLPLTSGYRWKWQFWGTGDNAAQAQGYLEVEPAFV